MNPYIPYLVGMTFVAMTALLTLMLTVVLENKAELERSITFNTSEPLLANAHVAFGHTILSGEAEAEFFIDDDVSNSPDVAADSPVTHALPGNPEPARKSSQSAVAGMPGTGKPENTSAQISPETSTLFSTSYATEDPTAAETNSLPVRSVHTSSDLATTRHTDFMQEQWSTARDTHSDTLDNIVMTHSNTIANLEFAIAQKTYNREQLQAMVIYNLNLMESQIRQLEDRLRPAFPSALAAYERMINKRRESFERMLQRREEILYRSQQNRDLLRENYSLLLDLLGSRTAINQA
jgi:hypothetical protein